MKKLTREEQEFTNKALETMNEIIILSSVAFSEILGKKIMFEPSEENQITLVEDAMSAFFPAVKIQFELNDFDYLSGEEISEIETKMQKLITLYAEACELKAEEFKKYIDFSFIDITCTEVE